MKRLILFALLLLGISAEATDAYLLLSDAQLQVGPYYTNRTIWLQSMSTPTVNSPSVVLGTKIIVTNSATGEYTWTNLFPGLYIVTVTAPPSRDQFAFFFDATNLGTINISDYLVANSTATFPAGTVAWAAAVTDLRYVRSTNVNITFNQVTNALGYTPQPSSGNLTNWSLLDTNILSDRVTTNGVLGIGATNWVAMLNGGSTNQVLKNPSLTNGINFGNAFSSRGASSTDEQFGSSAAASGGQAVALGNGAIASGIQATELGAGGLAQGAASTAIGGAAGALAANSTALGNLATANNASSTAIGVNATTTRNHQVMLGTSSEEVNVPGQLSAAGITNSAQTASTLTAADANQKLTSVVIGTGLSYDTSTRTLSSTTPSFNFQPASANLTNWSTLDTNVLSSKVDTNGVIGIGSTNWVGLLNGGSTNQVLLNSTSTNLINAGNALRSVGSVSTADQFGAGSTASGANSIALGGGIAASANTISIGTSSEAQGARSIAIGDGANVLGFTDAIAIGTVATAQHNGAVVIGNAATSSRANQITLGSGEEVNMPGHIVTQGMTNLSLTASELIATDANKAQQSVTLGNGLGFSGSTLSLSTDSTLTTGSGSLSVVGSALTGLNASSLASGTVPTARLGSGTANSTTVLHGDQTWGSVGSGSVTSVGLTMPAEFSVSGSPVTSSGTLAVTKASQSQNLVFASPSGSSGSPTFRALVVADLPSVSTFAWTPGGNSGTSPNNYVGTTDSTVMKVGANSVVGIQIKGNTQLVSDGTTDIILGNLGTSPNSITAATTGASDNSILGGDGNAIYLNGLTSVGDNSIVGGSGNQIGTSLSTPGSFNTIAGGSANLIDASAGFAFIAGGGQNHASGNYSFAAGRGAKAVNDGAFVWADDQSPTSAFTSIGANSFNVRAFGGVNYQLNTGTFSITSGGTTVTIDANTSIPESFSVASDQTTTSSTLGSTTLSTTLTSSKSYTFEITLFVNDSTAADGVKIAFGGGAVTATTFRCQTMITDTALLTSSQTTALTSTVTAATMTGNAFVKCSGFIKVNAGGTFIPQFAQNSHSTGTLTLYAGSNMRVTPTN